MDMNSRRFFFPFALATVFWAGSIPLSAYAITPEALVHFQKAEQLEKQKDYRGAEQEFQTTLGLDPYDSLTYVRLADIVSQDSRKKEALQLYQKALELNPKDQTVRLSMAQIYESLGEHEVALDQYQQFLAAYPDYQYAHLAMARLERELKHDDKAAEDYQAFLKVYPKHYDAERELAELHLADKQYSQAADSFKQLKIAHQDKFKDELAYGVSLNESGQSQAALSELKNVKNPSVLLYRQTGEADEKVNKPAEAYEAYQKALDLDPQDNSDLYLRQADLAKAMNQPDKTLAALQNYLKIHPDNAKIARSVADLQLDRKDYAAAAAGYTDALKHVPDSDSQTKANLLESLGYAEQSQNHLDQAILDYQSALALQDDRQTRLNLAVAYHQQKQYAKAVEQYRKLLAASDPQAPTIRKDMGQALLALGDQAYKSQDYKSARDDYQDAYILGDSAEVPALLGLANTEYAEKNTQIAYNTYQRVLEKDPDNITARINLAQLDLNQKNYLSALQNLRWVVAKKPDFLDAYKLLAQTHDGLKDYGQALIYYKKALELNPKDSILMLGYGNAWRQVGDLKRATQAYEMARDQAPDNAMVRFNLANVYNLQNHLEASLTEYRQAVKLDPNFAEPYYGMGITLEKQKKPDEALAVYEQYLAKAGPSDSYVPLAKQRVSYLKKSLPASHTNSAKPISPTAEHASQSAIQPVRNP